MLGRENLDTSIKSAEELAGLTKTMPLGIIAKITTSYDLARQRRRRLVAFRGDLLFPGAGRGALSFLVYGSLYFGE